MLNITHQKHRAQCKGFTLVELILAIGLFAAITALLLQNLFSIYRFREVIQYKKDINLEASLVLNNGVAGLIRSGFGINYSDTKSEVSQYLGANNPALGLRNATDELAIFMDRPEVKDSSGGRRYFKIHREAYQNSGIDSDTARLMLTFFKGSQKLEEIPLHSSELVVEDFDVVVPKKPSTESERDIQPYVNLYLRVRHRYPNGDISNVSQLSSHQLITASYRTSYMIRNNPL